MRNPVLMLLFLCFITGSEVDLAFAHEQTNANLAIEAMQKAKDFLARKQIAEGIAAYEAAVALDSHNSEIVDGLVLAWEEALKENPLAPENHVGLGRAFYARGDYHQAEQEFQQAIRFSPKKVNSLASALLAKIPVAEQTARIVSNAKAGSEALVISILDSARFPSFELENPVGLTMSFKSNGSSRNVEVHTSVNNLLGYSASSPALPIKNSPPPPTGEVDFGPFSADLQRRLKRNWFPPKGEERKRVVVKFVVHKMGHSSK